MGTLLFKSSLIDYIHTIELGLCQPHDNSKIRIWCSIDQSKLLNMR